MEAITYYKGYRIVTVSRGLKPYKARYRLAPFSVEEVARADLPGAFESEKEAHAAAVEAAKARIDEQLPPATLPIAEV